MNHLSIQVVNYMVENLAIQAIRHQVFEIEQGIAHELEFDGKDETAQHLLAYWNQKPVGTTRIRYLSTEIAKIERLAILPEFRGKGVGSELMNKALEIIRQTQVKQVIVHAQEYVKKLYLKLGFKVIGECFYEANIPHFKMVYTNSAMS
ncbi:MAG: GNAT family N-acetyltransferase [Microcoleaceae cyanobacterium]